MYKYKYCILFYKVHWDCKVRKMLKIAYIYTTIIVPILFIRLVYHLNCVVFSHEKKK